MRKSKPRKRILLPDPKFHDANVTRFVNNLMLQGKKSIAYSIFYDAIDMVGEKMKDSDKAPLDIWRKALENVTPQIEVKSRRVGGANFQVPTELRPERKISLSMIIQALPSTASIQPLAIATLTVLPTWKPASSWASSET